MKLKVLMKHIFCGTGKIAFCFLMMLFMNQIAIEVLAAVGDFIVIVVFVSGVFDLCFALFTAVTFFMKEENFTYWSRFKISITEDAVASAIYIAIFFVLLNFIRKTRDLGEILILLFAMVFIGVLALFITICMIRCILEIKSRNCLTITAKLLSKCKYHRWATHYCEIERNGALEKILLPERKFLKRKHDIIVGQVYEFEVFQARGSCDYQLLSIKNMQPDKGTG